MVASCSLILDASPKHLPQSDNLVTLLLLFSLNSPIFLLNICFLSLSLLEVSLTPCQKLGDCCLHPGEPGLHLQHFMFLLEFEKVKVVAKQCCLLKRLFLRLLCSIQKVKVEDESDGKIKVSETTLCETLMIYLESESDGKERCLKQLFVKL